MKTFEVFRIKKIILLSLAAVFMQMGCKASVSPILRHSGPSLMDELAPSDIISRYDTSNLVGIIAPRSEHYSIITQTWPASTRTTYDGTQNWGNATFIDSTGSFCNVLMCLFNKAFHNIPSSQVPSGSYAYSGNDLPIYTDGSTPNIVMVQGLDSSYGFAYDSLTFGAMPLITNIVRGQNVSRDSNITVNWSGTSNDFVSLMIYCWDSTGTNDTIGKGFAVGGYYNNTGSATLTVVPQQLVKGLADIELRKFEPKFITLSSGRRVCVCCETCEDITVHIVD